MKSFLACYLHYTIIH